MIAKFLARLGRFLFERHDARRISRQHFDSSGLSVLSDIPYISDCTPEHLLDIYRPLNSADDLPVIVNIHGGGLFASYKTVNTWFNYEWARMGYVVVSISYRRIPDTTLIHQIEDVMTALRFISIHRHEYRLNLDRCYLTGDSAGALLSLYALALEGSDVLRQAFGVQPSGICFRAAAFISIMLDIRRKDLLAFMSKVVTAPDESGKPYLPYIFDPGSMIGITQLPPLYLVTSAEDIIQKDTLKLDCLLTAADIMHHLLNFKKGKQNRLEHVFSVQYPMLAESREVYNEIDRFFHECK